ncbi:MAG: T9SS type A sorting domain-containing protein [Bacteroidetes bacterium]|nr:T9SS type A sorting domain-containing protein [Bacteroidota bacterium]
MILRRLITAVFIAALFAQSTLAGDLRHLLPRPKACFDRGTNFIVNEYSPIVVADDANEATLRAANFLQQRFFLLLGKTVPVIRASQYDGPRGIFIGVANTWPALGTMMHTRIPDGEDFSKPQSYILDIDEATIMLQASDTLGLFYGCVTIAQLTNVKFGTATTVGSHVYDYPDYPDRWVFSTHNLLVNGNVQTLRAIADTMAMYKLNGIQQSDFKYSVLQLLGPSYFANIDSLLATSRKDNIDIIPGVVGLGWSEGILYNDPNLAEGLHAVSKYIIEADTGRLIPDPRVTIPNGGFEQVDGTGKKFTGWTFYDGVNDPSTVDVTTSHSGSRSARCSNFTLNNPNGNARFNLKVDCDSNGYYVMSFWYKTDANYSGGFVQLLATGVNDGRTLTSTSLALQPSMDWTRAEVTINTLGNTSINLYCGVWGGSSGTIWYDDFQIKPGGLCNVLRRPGTPIKVTNVHTGVTYVEDVDFAHITDPSIATSNGSYFPWHTPPTFRRLTNGILHNGDTVLISYYHPYAAVSDNSGNGSVMACVSEDTLYKILRDQVTRVNNLYHGSTFMMGHDEIRNLDHDAACINRGLSPATLLADNVTKCHDLIRSISPNADICVWSDMFDSLHNATNNYYLVNGDLRGDWLNIPKDLTIMNWNGSDKDRSLRFFSNLGMKQIASAYYDVGDLTSILAWRRAMDSIPGVRGMMYTTWQNDYRFMVPYSFYAWGAGPSIIHVPLDSSRLHGVSIDVDAEVHSDPYDIADNVQSVELEIYDLNGTFLKQVDLGILSGAKWHATATNLYPNGYEYKIVATNRQRLTRSTPMYRIEPLNFVPVAGTLTSPDTLNFGDVPLDKPATKSLLVTNSPPSGMTVVMDSGVLAAGTAPFTLNGFFPTLFLGGAVKPLSITFAPTAIGNFSAKVRLYYSRGAMREAVLVAHAVQSTSVPMTHEDELSVSVVPNPFTSQALLTIRNASPSVKVTLTDILGRVTPLPASEQILLDATALGLSKGTYVLRVEDGATVITRNIINLK